MILFKKLSYDYASFLIFSFNMNLNRHLLIKSPKTGFTFCGFQKTLQRIFSNSSGFLQFPFADFFQKLCRKPSGCSRISIPPPIANSTNFGERRQQRLRARRSSASSDTTKTGLLTLISIFCIYS